MQRPAIQQQVTFIFPVDMERSADFYERVLGLELVQDQGDCRLYRVAAEAFLGICSCRPGRSSATGSLVLTFVTSQVDEWYQYLTAMGVPTKGPPQETPSHRIYNFYASDPGGHVVEFQRFLDPTWPAPRN
jgi:catechol 2,3-dioxygenase-like lactoylglutathione lyase family enzyme